MFREEFVFFYIKAPQRKAPEVQRTAGARTAPGQASLSTSHVSVGGLRNQAGCAHPLFWGRGRGRGRRGRPGLFRIFLTAQVSWRGKPGNQSAETDLGRRPGHPSPAAHLWLQSSLQNPNQALRQPRSEPVTQIPRRPLRGRKAGVI